MNELPVLPAWQSWRVWVEDGLGIDSAIIELSRWHVRISDADSVDDAFLRAAQGAKNQLDWIRREQAKSANLTSAAKAFEKRLNEARA